AFITRLFYQKLPEMFLEFCSLAGRIWSFGRIPSWDYSPSIVGLARCGRWPRSRALGTSSGARRKWPPSSSKTCFLFVSTCHPLRSLPPHCDRSQKSPVFSETSKDEPFEP